MQPSNPNTIDVAAMSDDEAISLAVLAGARIIPCVIPPHVGQWKWYANHWEAMIRGDPQAFGICDTPATCARQFLSRNFATA